MDKRTPITTPPYQVPSVDVTPDPPIFSLVTTFNARAPSRTVLSYQALNRQMRTKAHSALTTPLVLHHTRIYKYAMKKFCFNCQMRNEPFSIVIYHSSLVKGAMNAARVCKMRNGVKKRLNFFFFHRPKAEQRPQCTCQLRRDRVFKAQIGSLMFVNCGMKEKPLIQMCNEYSPQLSKLLA